MHVRDPGGFHAYLRRTIVNLTRSHHRRRAIERRYLERQTGPAPIDPPDISAKEALRAALMTLPARQRTAVVLRYYENLSEAETASLMGCRPAAVKSLVSRATSGLRTTLGDDA
jgi:RNA polymerase sigma factor (sigma-70 family)